MLKNGSYRGLVGWLYGRKFFKDNAGNYELTKGLNNEKLGLPKEDLDEFTKDAVESVEKGEVNAH